MKIVTVIAHAAFSSEREASLGKMLHDLPDAYVSASIEPSSPCEWSIRQWGKAVRMAEVTGATHALFLNDDLTLCQDFMRVLEKVIEANPNHVICLHNAHPKAQQAFEEGYRYITSPDGLIGTAWTIPIPALKAFLEWRENDLKQGVVECVAEDTLVNLWMMDTGNLIWSTVPALIDHDTSLPSLSGESGTRHPVVLPMPDMLDMNWKSDALHVGRVFLGNHRRMLTDLHGDRLHQVRRYYELAGDIQTA